MFESAVREQQYAVAKSPQDNEYKIYLCNHLENLGEQYLDLGDVARAWPYENQALYYLPQTQRRSPKRRGVYPNDLRVLFRLGSIKRQVGDPAAALEWFAEGRHVAEQFLKATPDQVTIRGLLARPDARGLGPVRPQRHCRRCNRSIRPSSPSNRWRNRRPAGPNCARALPKHSRPVPGSSDPGTTRPPLTRRTPSDGRFGMANMPTSLLILPSPRPAGPHSSVMVRAPRMVSPRRPPSVTSISARRILNWRSNTGLTIWPCCDPGQRPSTSYSATKSNPSSTDSNRARHRPLRRRPNKTARPLSPERPFPKAGPLHPCLRMSSRKKMLGRRRVVRIMMQYEIGDNSNLFRGDPNMSAQPNDPKNRPTKAETKKSETVLLSPEELPDSPAEPPIPSRAPIPSPT